MAQNQDTPRSRVMAPALLAILLIAAVRADASMLVLAGDGPTLRQFTSLARVVQRLAEVRVDRCRATTICSFVSLDPVSTIGLSRAMAPCAAADHHVRDELLSLPPPC